MTADTATTATGATTRRTHHVRLIGAPLDLGQSRRGVDMGPSALRIADLAETLRRLGHSVTDEGNVVVPQREMLGDADIMPAIAEVCREVAARTERAIGAGDFPLVLGGDHSVAAGSIAGAATAFAGRGGSIGVIWLDAHSDVHTPETSSSGNVHGMPVAHLFGFGTPLLASIARPGPAVRIDRFVYVGLRDVDAAERAFIREHDVAAYTMRDIDERGLPVVMHEAIARASDGTAGIYLSCDADWIDPRETPGVGTPVPGGATFREAHLAMEMLADTGLLIGMDFVEINPVLDTRNRSAQLGVQLIASALGKRTL